MIKIKSREYSWTVLRLYQISQIIHLPLNTNLN